MAKRTQEMLNERWKDKENERLLRKIKKQIRKEKEAAYSRTDKDEQGDEALQRLLNIAAKLREG